jgi:hypothetical protein
MNNNELEQQRIAAIGAISISDELISRLSENERVLIESRSSSDAASNMVTNVSDVIRRAISEMSTDSIEKSITTLRTLLAWMEESVIKSKVETARVEGVQDGMRRALEAVKQTGNMRITEIDKIIELAAAEPDESRRTSGERPEKLSLKRKAAELRKEQDT